LEFFNLGFELRRAFEVPLFRPLFKLLLHIEHLLVELRFNLFEIALGLIKELDLLNEEFLAKFGRVLNPSAAVLHEQLQVSRVKRTPTVLHHDGWLQPVDVGEEKFVDDVGSEPHLVVRIGHLDLC
jgi:hypothetical protein